MSQHLTKMQNMYTKLADLMSEATVNPEKLDKQPGIPMVFSWERLNWFSKSIRTGPMTYRYIDLHLEAHS